MESRKCKMMYVTCSSDDGRKRIMGTLEGKEPLTQLLEASCWWIKNSAPHFSPFPAADKERTFTNPLCRPSACFPLSTCKVAGVALSLVEVINGSGAEFSQIRLERAGLLCPTPVSMSGALLLVLVLDEHALNLAMPFCLGAGRGSLEKVLKLRCMAASPEIPGPKPRSLGN